MKRSVKFGVLIAMGLIVAAIAVLALSPGSRQRIKSMLGTTGSSAGAAMMSSSITAASLSGAGGACETCQDSCIRQYGLTQNALDVCNIQCSDVCGESTKGQSAAKDKNKKK